MYFAINSPHVIRETFDDDEVVIVNLNSGSYYSLEKVAAEIWHLLEKGNAFDEILADLALRYDGDGNEIEATVRQFFHELQQDDLIVSVESQGEEGRDASTNVTPGGEILKLPFQAPVLLKYTDMQELLVLDPIHEVDDSGWPKSRVGSTKGE